MLGAIPAIIRRQSVVRETKKLWVSIDVAAVPNGVHHSQLIPKMREMRSIRSEAKTRTKRQRLSITMNLYLKCKIMPFRLKALLSQPMCAVEDPESRKDYSEPWEHQFEGK